MAIAGLRLARRLTLLFCNYSTRFPKVAKIREVLCEYRKINIISLFKAVKTEHSIVRHEFRYTAQHVSVNLHLFAWMKFKKTTCQRQLMETEEVSYVIDLYYFTNI
nr:hypothetical transcript [Hymenolepis microstoma]